MLQLEIPKSRMMEYSCVSSLIGSDVPLPVYCLKQLLAGRILHTNSLPAHWALWTSLTPFQNALEMELMFAAGQCRRVTLTESLKANATCIIASILNATLYKGCSW
jgi:hypothetical protein